MQWSILVLTFVYFMIIFLLMIYFCRNGCTRSGLLVAISLVIEQKEIDEEVDIFQVVRRIQTRRPELLSSVVSLMHLIYEKVIVVS